MQKALQRSQILVYLAFWGKCLDLMVAAIQHTWIQRLLIIRNVEKNPIFSVSG
ncbi:10105_t:CDS:2 [Paraglomus occultum]|uniref:10105_t:CDS:1 n=1 Tax=Paraglomus occultum TaxID=144539 RepID=A0A9N8VNP9_9GLOM|nr:10105_t:CDS:2 [Paraglomus occultum]